MPTKLNIVGLRNLKKKLDKWCCTHNSAFPPRQIIEELCRIEYTIQHGGKPSTICQQTHDILQSCGIQLTPKDIGWVVV